MKRIIKKYKSLPVPVKSSLWITSSSILQKSIAFLTIPIFTRILTSSEVGEYNLYVTWYGIFTIFTTLSLTLGTFNAGMIQFEDEQDQYLSSMQGLTTCLGILFAIIIILFNKQISNAININSIALYLMSIQLIISPAFDFWVAKQRFKYSYVVLTLYTILLSFSVAIFGLISVLLFPDKGNARIYSYAVVNIVMSLFIYIYNFLKGKVFFKKKFWKRALKTNIPLIPHYLSSILLSSCDRIMINVMISSSVAGVFSISQQAANFILIITTSLNSSLVPWTYNKIKSNDINGISNIVNNVLIIILFFLFAILLFVPEILWILGPAEYQSGIWYFPPMAISIFFTFLYNLYANIEFYYGESKLIATASVVISFLNIILNYIFIKFIGAIGAAYVTLFCYILFSLLHRKMAMIVCDKNNLSKKIYNINMINYLSIVALILVIIFNVLYLNNIIRYIVILVSISIAFIYRNKITILIKQLRD